MRLTAPKQEIERGLERDTLGKTLSKNSLALFKDQVCIESEVFSPTDPCHTPGMFLTQSFIQHLLGLGTLLSAEDSEKNKRILTFTELGF